MLAANGYNLERAIDGQSSKHEAALAGGGPLQFSTGQSPASLTRGCLISVPPSSLTSDFYSSKNKGKYGSASSASSSSKADLKKVMQISQRGIRQRR